MTPNQGWLPSAMVVEVHLLLYCKGSFLFVQKVLNDDSD